MPSDRAAARWLSCTPSIPPRMISATYAEYDSTSVTVPQITGFAHVPRQPEGRARRSRSGRSAGSPGCRGTRRCRRRPTPSPGTAPGCGRCGRGRRASDTIRISGVDHSRIFTSSQNASSRRGNESTNTSPSKNAWRTLSQPGASGTSTTSATMTMIVLVAADDDRAPSLRPLVGGATAGRVSSVTRR